MVRKKIILSNKDEIEPLLKENCTLNYEFTFMDYFKLHEQFTDMKVLEGLASRTLSDHKKHMEMFKKYVLEEKRLQLDRYVEIGTFYEYLAYMKLQKGLNPSTINIRLRTLKCYLKWLYEEKYLNEDYSIKLKIMKTPEDTIRPLSESNIRKMLKMPNLKTYSGLRDFTTMIVVLDCGIRVSELLNLTVNDVDFKIGLINIRGEIAKTRGHRSVPISKKTCKLINQLVKSIENSGCELIFQSSYGGKLDELQLTKNYERYGKKAGINVRCTPYIFRHTFATNFIRQGGDVFTLQKIMGHMDIKTTRKYIQLDNEDLLKKHKQVVMIDKFI